jgi:protein SCO1/2
MIKGAVISILSIFTLLIFFYSAAVEAHEDNDEANVGLVEKTGQKVPLDLTFFDEDGRTVTLRELMTKPTILTLVYYSCSDICPQMLQALASALGEIKLEPGRDYKVVTISFDKDDTPAAAKEKKGNYIKASGITFPADAWKFLTGREENIERLTKAVGFSYRKEPGITRVESGSRKEARGFIHPTVLIFLATNGRIIRYIDYGQSHYGTLSRASFLSTDLTTAINDAAKGKVRVWSLNPIRLCFPGITREQELFYTVLSIVGALTLMGLVGFFIYLKKTEGTRDDL